MRVTHLHINFRFTSSSDSFIWSFEIFTAYKVHAYFMQPQFVVPHLKFAVPKPVTCRLGLSTDTQHFGIQNCQGFGNVRRTSNHTRT
jgi:hypothetical protein